MFAVQVRFLDSKEQPETVVLRRLYAVIGSQEHCHLIIDSSVELPWELRIRRAIGSNFFLEKVRLDSESPAEECEYNSFATVVVGDMEFFIYCIDPQVALDIADQQDLSLEKLGLQFVGMSSDFYPAFYSVSSPKVGLSIGSLNSLYIGKSRRCLFRVEDKDVAGEAFQVTRKGKNLVLKSIDPIQDFVVNSRKVESEHLLRGGDRILFSSTEILFLEEEDDFNKFCDDIGYSILQSDNHRSGYLTVEDGPNLNKSYPLVENRAFTIGRDPSQSLWIDKYFISRLHCTLMPRVGSLEIIDYSSNGTEVNSVKLEKARPYVFRDKTLDIVLGPGVKLAYVNGSTATHRTATGQRQIPEEVREDSLDTDLSEEVEATSFSHYQKIKLRQIEEYGSSFGVTSPFLSSTEVEAMEEGPLQVGWSRFLPQIFIGIVIIALSVVFIFLAKNMGF